MTSLEAISTSVETTCYHCGDAVKHDGLHFDGKAFCCAGCKTVYDILHRNSLCAYYSFDERPGIAPRPIRSSRFAYLDDADVVARIREFSDGTQSRATLFIPAMHCSSCVWLLEHLRTLDEGIVHSRVDFLRKRITLRYSDNTTSLRSIVELLASLGYEPHITLESVEQPAADTTNKSLYYKIGVAGFAFSNIMLFAFPDYLTPGRVESELLNVFIYVSLLLALPVLLYSASGYFLSAFRGVQKGIINIDFPIALGIFIQFARSLHEILTRTGTGYLDSMTGLVFFLLVGKLFQNKTFDALNFERTYKSYFPLAVLVRTPAGETTVPVSSLKVGNRILIRNQEIIPADSVLIKGRAAIDYSFVTGESQPEEKVVGSLLYAGGKQVGGLLELEVVKEVSQSYLTQLWNDAAFRLDEKARFKNLSDTISKYFTGAVLLVAAAAGVYWFPDNPATAWNAITGILIVACPCALALAVPFAFGTAQRIFGRNGFYLKHARVIEELHRVRTIVFDKTGTLTRAQSGSPRFVGGNLTDEEKAMVTSLVRNSHHPLSRALTSGIVADSTPVVEGFVEIPNAGIEARCEGKSIRIGSESFARGFDRNDPGEHTSDQPADETRVYLAINGILRGYFTLTSTYRDGVRDLMSRLKRRFHITVLSGDSDRERQRLQQLLGADVEMHFRQSPAEKMAFVGTLQQRKGTVLMVGDGLNDAGALQKADTGVALTDNIASFSPACDAILDGKQLTKLDMFLRFSTRTVQIVLASFAVSFLYNLVALGIAFQGLLSPLVAAILMPISSITVVVLATSAVQMLAARKGLI